MEKSLIVLAQLVLFIAVAPLLSGLITKIKNNIRMRRGQSVFQPYYNLGKLFLKDEVISDTASWIFKFTPIIVVSSMLTAALLVPVFILFSPLHNMGDFLCLVFIFALGRFFLALAALDTASSFGGMGSSREMFISSLTEPVLCLVIFAVSYHCGSTDISVLGMHTLSISAVIAALALLLVTIAETSRIPVDNQETHLELTMVHEAMVLEYSGRKLAFIEMASYIKQMILFFLLAQVVLPIALPDFGGLIQISLWFLWYLARIAIIAVIVGVIEVTVAKMRLFRVTDFLGFGFVLGVIALVCAMLGV